jgi:hypothetical protein
VRRSELKFAFTSLATIMSTSQEAKAHPMLATELLGYQPQLLLDELMSSVNETIYESIARVEEFLNNWIDEKEKAGEDVEHLRKDMDQVSTRVIWNITRLWLLILHLSTLVVVDTLGHAFTTNTAGKLCRFGV